MSHVRATVEKNNSAMVWSPNFSIGVNVFSAWSAKPPACSPTSRNTAPGPGKFIITPRKTRRPERCIKLVDDMKAGGYQRPIDVSSNRAGAHPGTHEVGFDSAADTITLRHTARSREGFARGALKAAQFIAGKKGIFEFSEILFER